MSCAQEAMATNLGQLWDHPDCAFGLRVIQLRQQGAWFERRQAGRPLQC